MSLPPYSVDQCSSKVLPVFKREADRPQPSVGGVAGSHLRECRMDILLQQSLKNTIYHNVPCPDIGSPSPHAPSSISRGLSTQTHSRQASLLTAPKVCRPHPSLRGLVLSHSDLTLFFLISKSYLPNDSGSWCVRVSS